MIYRNRRGSEYQAMKKVKRHLDSIRGVSYRCPLEVLNERRMRPTWKEKGTKRWSRRKGKDGGGGGRKKLAG